MRAAAERQSQQGAGENVEVRMFSSAIRWRAAAAAAVLCAAATVCRGQLVFSNIDGITGQLSGPAAPYPSEIVVSGLTEPVALVRVRIGGLSHELSPQELDILLVAPTGETVLLMSDVGALAPVNGIDLEFDDQYPALSGAALVSGTYAPTNLDDGIGTDGFDGPAPAGPYGGTLGVFRGKVGNGTWKLFVMDDTGGDAGSIASWELEIYQGTCVVTAADSGPGSLRDVIELANLDPGLTTICFAIPQSDPGYDPLAQTWTILPQSALPMITAPVVIDGLTQPGAGCVAWPPTQKIVLNGAAAGVGAAGLRLGEDADASVIRGLVINGFSSDGVRLEGADDVRIWGCFIGTDHLGLLAAANGGDGVRIAAGSEGALVGTDGDSVDDECERNVLSGNTGAGISIRGASAVGTDVAGNLVGPGADEQAALGNGLDGVLVADGRGAARIGPANVIAFNAGNGVNIAADAGIRNYVSLNSIHSNALLGVNLGAAGVDANDALDADSGANGLINWPVVTSIAGTTINGEYSGAANADFVIEVFQNAAADDSGHGEGMIPLGETTCTTDGNGFGTWTLSGVVYRTTPLYIAATASDDADDEGTSEFGPVALTNLCKLDCPLSPVEIAAGPGCMGIAAYSVPTQGNCDPTVTIEYDPPAGTPLPLGGTTVTARLRNAAGDLLDECTFTALVVDQMPPMITCPNPIMRPNDPDLCGAAVSFAAMVSDNCDPNPVLAYSIADGMGGQTAITSPHFFPVGTTTVTVNATDSADNAATPCTFDVTVNDTQGPILVCSTVVEVEADQFGNVVLTPSLVFPGGVVDNCPDCAVTSILFAPPVIDCALLQDYVVMVTAMDCRGNTSTCTVTVRVTGPDCNENGVSDGCDIRMGTSDDCNENLIPDECECLWCNGEPAEDAELAEGQASHLGGGSPMGNRVVDDIYFPPGCVQRLTAFEGWMLTSSIPELRRAKLEFYDDCNGAPAAEPFLTVGPERSEVVSAEPAADGLFLVKYRFDLCDLCLWLDGGRTYWVGLIGLTDSVDMSDISYWVVDQREEARIMGRPAFKAEGQTIPGWNQPFEFGPWEPIEDCCVGCHNMVFCIFGDSCKLIWDNGPAGESQADALASPASGAHRSQESKAADDFVTPTCEPQEVCLIDAWVWTDCEPPHGFVEIYENEPCDGAAPADEPLARFDADKAIETGITATIGGRPYRLVVLRIVDPGWIAPAGRTLWLSAGVESTGSFVVGSRFALVNDECVECEHRVAPAQIRSIRPIETDWTTMQPPGALAFRIATRIATDPIPAASPGGAEACAADANGDGALAVDDIFTFLSAWFVGCP